MTDESRWKTIDSAPKDGTDVLLWDGYVMAVGHWGSTYSSSTPWWLTPDEFHEPTHWQPLPDPPE